MTSQKSGVGQPQSRVNSDPDRPSSSDTLLNAVVRTDALDRQELLLVVKRKRVGQLYFVLDDPSPEALQHFRGIMGQELGEACLDDLRPGRPPEAPQTAKEPSQTEAEAETPEDPAPEPTGGTASEPAPEQKPKKDEKLTQREIKALKAFSRKALTKEELRRFRLLVKNKTVLRENDLVKLKAYSKRFLSDTELKEVHRLVRLPQLTKTEVVKLKTFAARVLKPEEVADIRQVLKTYDRQVEKLDKLRRVQTLKEEEIKTLRKIIRSYKKGYLNDWRLERIISNMIGVKTGNKMKVVQFWLIVILCLTLSINAWINGLLPTNPQDALAQANREAGRATGTLQAPNPDGPVQYGWASPLEAPQMTNPAPKATFTSGYGNRTHPVTGGTKFHEGIDLAADTGTPIYAAWDGKVVIVGDNGDGYGNAVAIDHGGFWTWYAHNSRVLVHQGQEVKAGTHIADMGSTGMSTGPHLHFSIYLKRDSGQDANRPYVNGTHTNPEPYYKEAALPGARPSNVARQQTTPQATPAAPPTDPGTAQGTNTPTTTPPS